VGTPSRDDHRLSASPGSGGPPTVDPQTPSANIEVVDDSEAVLATGRLGTDKVGLAATPKHVAGFPELT
jgi:hypothetical protein